MAPLPPQYLEITSNLNICRNIGYFLYILEKYTKYVYVNIMSGVELDIFSLSLFPIFHLSEVFFQLYMCSLS